jgi:hypothetical protein
MKLTPRKRIRMVGKKDDYGAHPVKDAVIREGPEKSRRED